MALREERKAFCVGCPAGGAESVRIPHTHTHTSIAARSLLFTNPINFLVKLRKRLSPDSSLLNFTHPSFSVGDEICESLKQMDVQKF
jgi:hypothetical protein